MTATQNHGHEEACLDAMLLVNAHVFPLVLNAALELDLFTIIAKAGPGAYVSATEIASQLPTQNPDAPSMLDRMLQLFTSHSLLNFSLRYVDDGEFVKQYGLTPACKFFLRGEDANANLIKALTLSHKPAVKQTWLNMKYVILEGGNLFKKVHGKTMFEYMNQDSELSTFFNEAMAGFSNTVMKEILDKYKGFSGVSSLVDVAGGVGRTLNMIISKHTTIKGINYDMPYVVNDAPSYPGIKHVGGDMFSSIPKADAIMIKDTCHNWSDENVIKVFLNIYEALPKKGKLIIVSIIIPETPKDSKASQCASAFDNSMLTLHAGRQRTASMRSSLRRLISPISMLVVLFVVYGPLWNLTSEEIIEADVICCRICLLCFAFYNVVVSYEPRISYCNMCNKLYEHFQFNQ